MRRVAGLGIAVFVIVSGCNGSPELVGGATTEPTPVVLPSTSRVPTTTAATTALTTPTTTAPTTATTLPSIDQPESGLFCRDLDASGYSYSEAVTYWIRERSPDRMDADRNGIPCETVYPRADVVEYWGDPLPTTTRVDAFYSIATHGLHPDELSGSGEWLGSGCSPDSDTLPDGIWWGYSSDLSESSITFDLACVGWIDETDDDPATEDYGGWVIENNNPKRRVVPVAPTAHVRCPGMYCPPNPFPYDEWVEDDRLPHGDSGRETDGLWIYVNDGVVTEVGIPVFAG